MKYFVALSGSFIIVLLSIAVVWHTWPEQLFHYWSKKVENPESLWNTTVETRMQYADFLNTMIDPKGQREAIIVAPLNDKVTYEHRRFIAGVRYSYLLNTRLRRKSVDYDYALDTVRFELLRQLATTSKEYKQGEYTFYFREFGSNAGTFEYYTYLYIDKKGAHILILPVRPGVRKK